VKGIAGQQQPPHQFDGYGLPKEAANKWVFCWMQS
jgi:hypothetical protein